jgi:peroxiredoxin
MEEIIMFSSRKSISLIIALCLTFAGILAQGVGDQAPDFSYQNLMGDTVTLSDFKGKVVFLFLFGNGCPSCKSIGNDTETKVEDVYGSRDDFQALGLDMWNSTSNVANVTAFQSFTKISYPLLLKAGDMEQKYSTSYDRLIVIDQEGKIRHKGGTVVSSDLDNAITMIEALLSTTGTDDLEGAGKSGGFRIYPNPVDDYANLRFNLKKQETVAIGIYNLTGQQISRLSTETYPAGDHVRKIPTRGMSPGMYLIRMAISGEIYTGKIMVKE